MPKYWVHIFESKACKKTLVRLRSAIEVNLDNLNSKSFSWKAPNQVGGPSVSLSYTLDIFTGMP